MPFKNALSAAVACLLLAAVSGRELKVVRIDCCENGFSLESSAVSVQVEDENVQVTTPFVNTTTTPSGTVVESPVVFVDTRGQVKVEVGSGEVLNFRRREDGQVEVLVGKEGKLVTMLVEEEEEGRVDEHDVVVDFSNEEGLVLVQVGEGGKIVDAKVGEDGKGKVQVGEEGKLAVVNLTGRDLDMVVEGYQDGTEGDDDLKVEISGENGVSTFVKLKGTDVVDTSVTNI